MKKNKVGIAGAGALGSIVANALLAGIDGYDLVGIAEVNPPDLPVANMSFDELADAADIVVECLPASAVPDIAKPVLARDKKLILISSSALMLYPELHTWATQSKGRLIVPSGALSGLDAVSALKEGGIDAAKIVTTKPPRAFAGAPFIVDNSIDLAAITQKTRIFSGNAHDAAKAFPANVNVAATLSLAGIGPEKTMVEIWADPDASANSHEITVRGGRSTITSRIENQPDPANPKSSTLAAYSILSALRRLNTQVAIV